MAKRYARINFVNNVTTVGPTNLNKMDKGIDDLDNAVVEMESDIDSINTSLTQLNNDLNPTRQNFTPYLYGNVINGAMTCDRQVGYYWDYGTYMLVYIYIRITGITTQPTGTVYVGGIPTIIGTPTYAPIYSFSARINDTTLPWNAILQSGYDGINNDKAYRFLNSNIGNIAVNNSLQMTVMIMK